MVVENCIIKSKENTARGIYDIWVHCPEIAKNAQPGQFVDVKCKGFTLRRPISICDVNDCKSQIRLVFQQRGEGTAWLAEKNEGDTLDILGPLGHGFPLSDGEKDAVFVGGGIGVPPLLLAAKHFGCKADVIIGFRSADFVILDKDFESYGADVTVCTDDGSAGEHCLVTKPLAKRLDAGVHGAVFACGPHLMLKSVAGICEKRGVPCFVSMEERMACGIGACLSCACKVKYDGKEKYLHVCKDGPVFDSKNIVWD